MAQKKENRYIQFYMDGNVARVINPAPEKTVSLPAAPKLRRKVVHLDLTATCAIIMSVALLITMMIGLVQLRGVRQDRIAMENYVMSLRNESIELSYTYNENLDLEKVQAAALAQGMIPAKEAYRIPITVNAPVEEKAPSFWQAVGVFFTGLFA